MYLYKFELMLLEKYFYFWRGMVPFFSASTLAVVRIILRFVNILLNILKMHL